MRIETSCSRRTALGALAIGGLAALLPGGALAAPEEQAPDWRIRAEKGGRAGQPDRYHIEIPASAMTRPLARLRFDFSAFSAAGGRVTSGGVKLFAQPTKPGAAPAEISLQSIHWAQPTGALAMAANKAIAPGTALDLVIDVTNPAAGTYYPKGEVLAPGEADNWLGLAVWVIEIGG